MFGRRNHRRTNRELRRFLGMLTLIAVFLSAAGLLVSLAIGIYPERNIGFAVVPREPYTHSFDPIQLVELGLPPETTPADSAQLRVTPKDAAVRVMVIRPDRVSLLIAGASVRELRTPHPVADIRELMNLIDDPAWIAEPRPGQLLVKAAVVTHWGVDFTVGSPTVKDVLLLSIPTVFIGTRGGTINFDHVDVHSLRPPGDPTGRFRPFVLATDFARMTITNSHLFDLGWDWNASYGVAWEQGSTGMAVGSSFHHNFIGVYTGRADGLTFRDCVFSDNALYGLDPHTYSNNLTVDHVLAENNRAHGIIFSDYVRNSVIKNSISRNNGENGIMMDEHSTGNHIFNNVVTGNKGDGLVTARSPDNTFADNHIEDNRVGVRIDASDTSSTVLEDNRFLNNATASENVSIDGSNSAVGNGGQWNWPIVRRTWLTVGASFGCVAVLLGLGVERARRGRSQGLTVSLIDARRVQRQSDLDPVV